jgi:flagellar biogenesis protein FliO
MEISSPALCFFLASQDGNFQSSNDHLWIKVVLFLLVLVFIAFLVRRFTDSGSRIYGKPRDGRIRISETCSLGNKNYLIVAQCDQERHPLGVGPNFCQYLTKLNSVTFDKTEQQSPSSENNENSNE